MIPREKRGREAEKAPLLFCVLWGHIAPEGEGDELQPIRDNLRASEGVSEGVGGEIWACCKFAEAMQK